jgi:hypothetical protein
VTTSDNLSRVAQLEAELRQAQITIGRLVESVHRLTSLLDDNGGDDPLTEAPQYLSNRG